MIIDLGVEIKDVRVIISMMVLCIDIIIIEYDRRRSGLPNAPVVMEHDNNRTEQKPSKHNPYSRTWKQRSLAWQPVR